MNQFEGIDFGTQADVNQLVIDQLSTGKYRGKMDGSPSDWLLRAWKVLSPPVQKRLSNAIHKALILPRFGRHLSLGGSFKI